MIRRLLALLRGRCPYTTDGRRPRLAGDHTDGGDIIAAMRSYERRYGTGWRDEQ